MTELNAILRADGYTSITTALIIAHVSDESVYYVASAGHPAAFIRRSAARDWEPINVVGEGVANLPLGAVDETSYSEHVLPAIAGDRLFLYTDGLTEVRSPEGEMLGIERVLEHLVGAGEQSPSTLKSGLLAHLRAHSANAPWDDDITLIFAELH